MNGGICINRDDGLGFECFCRNGFINKICLVNVNDCLFNFCYSGNCIDLVNNFKCDCFGSIIGRICVGLVNVCNIFFCYNGGICIFINFLY